jgi:hypothetical protein
MLALDTKEQQQRLRAINAGGQISGDQGKSPNSLVDLQEAELIEIPDGKVCFDDEFDE